MDDFKIIIDGIYNNLYGDFEGYGQRTSPKEMLDRVQRELQTLERFKYLFDEAVKNYGSDLEPHREAITKYVSRRMSDLIVACHNKPL